MLLCETDMKKQVESIEEYPGLEKKMDSIAPLILIEKLAYTGGTNDLNTRHKKAIVHLNLINLHQDRFQTIKDFRNQDLAMKSFCDTVKLLLEGARMTRWQL